MYVGLHNSAMCFWTKKPARADNFELPARVVIISRKFRVIRHCNNNNTAEKIFLEMRIIRTFVKGGPSAERGNSARELLFHIEFDSKLDDRKRGAKKKIGLEKNIFFCFRFL